MKRGTSPRPPEGGLGYSQLVSTAAEAATLASGVLGHVPTLDGGCALLALGGRGGPETHLYVHEKATAGPASPASVPLQRAGPITAVLTELQFQYKI